MDSSQQADSTGRESSETAEKTPKKKRRFSFQKKMVVCRVTLLDGNTFEPKDIDKSADGFVLFDKVCRHLDLVESDYFGLSYRDDSGKRFWLDGSKKIAKQVKGGTWVFEFNVKFYPPDPNGGFKEDLSRYLLCLQLRVDIFNGRLPCSFVTYALLGSYTVQSELGDYNPVEHGKTPDYLKDFDFAPNQTPELLEKIMELHKHHKGLTPSEADHNFLENAKKLAMFGVDLHEAKDSDRTDIMLGVCASGILVYKDKLRINRFVWPKILNLSYKRNNFYIKVRPGEFEPHEKTIGFKLENHKMAKRVWKTCVEHHAFFRLKEGEKASSSTLFPRFNSKFRYSGRTQAQARKAAEMVNREQPHITRTAERKSLSYPDNKAKSMDELAQRKNQLENNDDYYPDGKDKRDHKGVPTAITGMGPPPDSKLRHEDGKNKSAPGSGDTSDRRDRLPGEGGDELATEQSKAGQLGSAELENAQLTLAFRAPGDKDLTSTEKDREKGREEQKNKDKDSKDKDKDKINDKNKDKDNETNKDKDKDKDKINDKHKDKDKDKNKDKTTDKDKENEKKTGGLFGKFKKTPEKDKDKDKGKGDKDKDKGDREKDGMDRQHGKGTYKSQLDVELKPGSSVDAGDKKAGKKRHGSASSSSSSSSEDGEGKLKHKSAKEGPDMIVTVTPGFGVEGDLAGGLGLKPGDYSSIDRKMEFIPLKPPNTTTKKSTSSEGEETMPFFNPAGDNTLDKQKKVPPPVAPKGIRKGFDSEEDRHMKTDSIHDQTVFMYKTEKDGVVETRVERKITVTSDDTDNIDDDDDLLAKAILEVTQMNKDMSVEKIDICRQIEEGGSTSV
ncbi:hypothetical protein ACJMK2_041729 [Sinanodonta woodiana]|uniref:FERM domain-containing protein n=1 Tax=Sinanodonta woodiana TaxID=1069815 RepID=A0ABD3W8V2_SINWO